MSDDIHGPDKSPLNPFATPTKSNVGSRFAPPPPPAPEKNPSFEQLSRIFNTALVSSRAASPEEATKELFRTMDTPPFRALLVAIKTLAAQESISEREAAEQIITTFRRVDLLWGNYIFQEGAACLFKPKT